MSVLNIQTAPPAGLTPVTPALPSIIYILTNDTYATVTATGYLTNYKNEGVTFSNNQMALVYTSDEGPVWTKVVITYSGSVIQNTVITLAQMSSPGDVVLPTIANNILVSTDTVGTLANTTATAVNRGSIQAGLSGDAGTLISFPGTAANGSLIVAAVNAGGAFNTTISNGTTGQSQVISIPDSGATTGNFIISKFATTQNITVGALQVDAGAITSGLSAGGFVGLVKAFPTTATTGFIAIQGAINASGNFGTTISNSTAQAQAQVITIPSAGAATGSFVLTAAAAAQTITSSLSVTGGSISSGVSGTAGTFISFPGTAANGTLILAAVNAGGAFNTTISNGTTGQSQVVSIPDSGATTANFIISKFATTQHITVGHLQVDAGSLVSGISTGGTVGLVKAFPTTATTGFIAMQAAINGSGDFGTTISNAVAQGQAQVMTVPDVGAATGQFLVKTAALVSGNFVMASGTAGLTVDSGLPAVKGLQYVTVAISASEFNAMYTTPKLLVAAGGANTLIVLDKVDLLMTYVSAAYAAGGVAAVQYDATANGAGVIASTTLAAATFQPTASTGFMFNTGVVAQTFTTCVNKGLYLSNVTGVFTTGDSTFVAHIWYKIIPTT